MRNDEELSKVDFHHAILQSLAIYDSMFCYFMQLLGNVTIAAGGVLPNIHSVLLPKKTGKKDGASGSVSQEF